MVPLVLMQLGEVVFGGVGSGLYGMLVFAILAVFIAGLMIGRTPEYLGKKIEAYEMKMVVDRHPGHAAAGAGRHRDRRAAPTPARPASPTRARTASREMLYAFTSAANNNGSAFAGLSANTPFYNALLAHRDVVRPLRRDRAGAGDRRFAGGQEAHAGRPRARMPTHGPLFVALLIGTVLLVGALNYVPALALGPVVEHLQCSSRAADRKQLMITQDTCRCSTRRCSAPAIVDSFRKLDPRGAVAQPGDVRRLRRQHPHHAAVRRRRWPARAKRRPASSSRSRCGCGSPCCSPTSPRRWPKAAARRRPRRCAA